jgi:hypothetical protein
MVLEDVATRLETKPAQLERDSLRLYVERRLRLVESELFGLARSYGVVEGWGPSGIR